MISSFADHSFSNGCILVKRLTQDNLTHQLPRHHFDPVNRYAILNLNVCNLYVIVLTLRFLE
ncbi:hypothetical protein HanPSC8_Chr01g0015291 [Helianthus annuus]|nr:hypothetical protein HanPSC8_Chr01g0015291 [Helianthus annuus]